MGTSKFTDKEIKNLNDESKLFNVTTKIEFLNGNFTECFKKMIQEMKNKLNESNLSGSNDVSQKFDELVASVSDLNFTTSSFNKINDFLLALLKTTQDMALLVDSIPVRVFENA